MLILDNLTDLPHPKVGKTQKKWKPIHFQRLLIILRIIQVTDILQNHQIQRNKKIQNSLHSSGLFVIFLLPVRCELLYNVTKPSNIKFSPSSNLAFPMSNAILPVLVGSKSKYHKYCLYMASIIFL